MKLTTIENLGRYYLFINFFFVAFAIAWASSGGTAFPTCLNACVLATGNMNESLNYCSLAASLTVIDLASVGWTNI